MTPGSGGETGPTAPGPSEDGAGGHGPDRPIEDYALIGNCRTAALVGRDGSLDWLCLPRFDGASLFGALLDRERGGSYRVGPAGEAVEVRRRYVGPTAVLETTFTTASGVLRLTDWMPVDTEEGQRRRPWPEHHLARRVECLEGEVEVEVRYQPRPRYGTSPAPLEDRGPLGFWCRRGSEIVALLSDLPLRCTDGGDAVVGRCALPAGEARHLSLVYASNEPVVLIVPDALPELLDRTLRWWEGWAEGCDYDGPYHDAVIRSALTLKLLTYAPSGAVVAAPTTSLPEVPGGGRNWDYRFCWLRDASWTLRALFELGYTDEAAAFYDWFMYATRLTAPDLQTVYDLHGRTHLRERELDHLAGWRGSRPVRVGNAAHRQLQLDVYGEVVSAAYEYIQRGGSLDRQEARLLVGVGNTVCQRWSEPDEGIWEIRGGRRHWTYSKVMCAVALQRLLDLHEQGHLQAPAERFREVRDRIRDELEARSHRQGSDAYASAYDLDLSDAALLRLPMVGYLKATTPGVRSTFRRVREELDAGDGLLYRYPPEADNLEGGEGAFGICSFWAVELQALAGDVDDATEDFETMLDHANDVGLYSEQIEPGSGAFLGNFPQAFTHLGLINAALTLEAASTGGERRPIPWEHEKAPGDGGRTPVETGGDAAAGGDAP